MLHFMRSTERETALKRQYNQLKQSVGDMQSKLKDAESQLAGAQSDRKDVLRLIDIMSASPAGITTVLDAYLKKLGKEERFTHLHYGPH